MLTPLVVSLILAGNQPVDAVICSRIVQAVATARWVVTDADGKPLTKEETLQLWSVWIRVAPPGSLASQSWYPEIIYTTVSLAFEFDDPDEWWPQATHSCLSILSRFENT